MRFLIYILGIVTLLTSCNNSGHRSSKDKFLKTSKLNSSNNEGQADDYELNLYKKEQVEGFEDGTYSADVDYYNPKTRYYATYTLDVEVENNQVTIIYFPNDGYLDDDHIWPDILDENGFVRIEGEDGKTYEVQIYY